ncbi:MAG: alpha/beta hydrolase [Candidatus Micrarchaeota archaeon]|nr:alpha/beta hydrolase [Candidatus Micrarchaeota archaeon]
MQILIVHGLDSDSKDNWFPWLKAQLEGRGSLQVCSSTGQIARSEISVASRQPFTVECPDMPNSKNPKQEEWLAKLSEVTMNCKDSFILVGHSLGTIAVLRFLEKTNLKLMGVILVAGFTQGFGVKAISDFFKTPFDFEKIRTKSKKFIVISSDNDPYLPITEGKKLADKLNAEFIVEKNAGHIDSESGFSKYERILDIIIKLKMELK